MDPIQWYRDIPLVTRLYLTASVLSSFAVYVGGHTLEQRLGMASGMRMDLWRPFTSLFYLGRLNHGFLTYISFNIGMLAELETVHVDDSTSFVWLIVMLACLIIPMGILFNIKFLGRGLLASLAYIWSRLTPNRFVLGFFYFDIPLWHFIHLMALFILFADDWSSLTSKQDMYAELIGVVAGHLVFFGYFVLPVVSGKRPLAWRWHQVPQEEEAPAVEADT